MGADAVGFLKEKFSIQLQWYKRANKRWMVVILTGQTH